MKQAGTAILLAIALTAACSRANRAPVPITLVPAPLPAASPGSALPHLSVSGNRAIASWVEHTPVENAGSVATLKFADRTATGWSEPRTVASGKNWFVSWADVPSVVRLDDGTLAAHWLQTTDTTIEAYDLLLSFSADDGRTWSPPATPHHDGTQTQHGFASLFQQPGARLGLVWLDGRAMEFDKQHGNDNMSIRAAMFDRDGRQLSEALVDPRVCDCCPTATAVTAEGPVAVFRDRSATDVRDISIARLVNGAWTEPAPVHDDHWQIAACPVNGPAVSANGRLVVVAWMTAAEDQGRAFAAFSADAGATFGAPIRLDDAQSLGRVGVVLLDDGSAIASWVEFADGRGQFRFRRVEASGRRGPAQTVSGISTDRTNGLSASRTPRPGAAVRLDANRGGTIERACRGREVTVTRKRRVPAGADHSGPGATRA